MERSTMDDLDSRLSTQENKDDVLEKATLAGLAKLRKAEIGAWSAGLIAVVSGAFPAGVLTG